MNTDKTEAAFFTMAAKEIKFKPEFVIEGEIIKVKPNPHLLGVYLDCKM